MDQKRLDDFYKSLPIIGNENDGKPSHIFELPDLGVVTLLHDRFDIEPLILKSLKPIFSKLSGACKASPIVSGNWNRGSESMNLRRRGRYWKRFRKNLVWTNDRQVKIGSTGIRTGIWNNSDTGFLGEFGYFSDMRHSCNLMVMRRDTGNGFQKPVLIQVSVRLAQQNFRPL